VDLGLVGRRAIVTGGSKGLGKAIAAGLVAEGGDGQDGLMTGDGRLKADPRGEGFGRFLGGGRHDSRETSRGLLVVVACMCRCL
jgi:NAD(P)-dependent dehydrogenase (short-subunit alcohol dehydrogenase family)